MILSMTLSITENHLHLLSVSNPRFFSLSPLFYPHQKSSMPKCWFERIARQTTWSTWSQRTGSTWTACTCTTRSIRFRWRSSIDWRGGRTVWWSAVTWSWIWTSSTRRCGSTWTWYASTRRSRATRQIFRWALSWKVEFWNRFQIEVPIWN